MGKNISGKSEFENKSVRVRLRMSFPFAHTSKTKTTLKDLVGLNQTWLQKICKNRQNQQG